MVSEMPKSSNPECLHEVYNSLCKKNDLFYQSICYSLRLLNNSSGHHLRWLACLKGLCFFFWIPVCPKLSPKSLRQSREIVNLWPGQIPGEGQVWLSQGYKEEPLSAISCMSICLVGVSTCLVEIFCLLCVCFWHKRVINSNNLGFHQGYYIPSGKGEPLALPLGDPTCCLAAVAQRFSWQWQLPGSVNELGLQNFLTTWVKELWRQERWQSHEFCAQTSQGWQSNDLVVGILGLCDVWIRCVGWHVAKVESLIHSSEVTSYYLSRLYF
jgi:hypothetical protein